MPLMHHVRQASLEITHAAGTLAKEYYHAGLPCRVIDSAGTRVDDLPKFQRQQKTVEQVPVVRLPRADLDILQSQLSDELRRQFLGENIVDIVPFRSDSSTDTSLYVADWIFRLEHRGQVALLPEMVRHFFVIVSGQSNNYLAVVQNLMNRENIEGPLQNAFAYVNNNQEPIIVRFAGYPWRLLPKVRLMTISATKLIV